jgi:integrase
MIRRSYQQGYVSEPIRTARGVAYRIRYRLRDGNTKWVHKCETLYGLAGKKAARGVLDQRIRESENKTIDVTDLTALSFIETYWRPYLERKQVKPSTRRSYESSLKLHIIPRLGNLRLTDISPLHIESLVTAKLKSGSSQKTVRNLVGLLQGIFSLAVDNDLLSRSPVRDRHKPQVTRSEKPVWTSTQLKLIIDSAPDKHRGLFQSAMLTGARVGELLGLQWKHIKFKELKLEIRQALWDGQLVAPKTAGSVRTIYFGPALELALAVQLQNAIHTKPDDFVFCKLDGSPLNPDVLRRDVLYPMLDRLGISRTSRSSGFHTFRHSAASIVNQETGNLKLAQKFLGHSNLSTTADVYTHTSAEAERTAAHALEQAIYGNLFQTVPQIRNKNSSEALN